MWRRRSSWTRRQQNRWRVMMSSGTRNWVFYEDSTMVKLMTYFFLKKYTSTNYNLYLCTFWKKIFSFFVQAHLLQTTSVSAPNKNTTTVLRARPPRPPGEREIWEPFLKGLEAKHVWLCLVFFGGGGGRNILIRPHGYQRLEDHFLWIEEVVLWHRNLRY